MDAESDKHFEQIGQLEQKLPEFGARELAVTRVLDGLDQPTGHRFEQGGPGHDIAWKQNFQYLPATVRQCDRGHRLAAADEYDVIGKLLRMMNHLPRPNGMVGYSERAVIRACAGIRLLNRSGA